jgi:hypothetical protein
MAAQPLPPPRVGAVDRPPRPLHMKRMQPPPRASSPLAVGPKEKPVLSSFNNSRRVLAAPFCLSLCSSAPSAKGLTTAHRSCVPLSHAKPAAEPPSTARNYWSTEPATSFICWGCLPIEHHLQSPMCSSITVATSAWAHCRSTNPEPAPSTSSPACRRQFPPSTYFTAASPSRWAPPLPMHQIGTLTSGLAPWHLLPRPLTTDRPDSAGEPRAGGGMGGSPVSSQVRRPNWAKLLSPAGPCGTTGVAHYNSALFLLSFELFKISLNF